MSSVFIGGGTPSLLSGEQIALLLDALRTSADLEADAEITMEANPGTLSPDKLERIRRAGVNRLSLGLQSTDDALLQRLGRIHSYGDFLESYQAARRAGFENINIDLIYGLPCQSPAGLRESLEKVLALSPEHLSLYALIVEEGTPFFEEEKSGRLDLPDEDLVCEMEDLALALLEGAGYARYEISNFAKAGYACRHNLGYWRREEYAGLGLGAASLLGGELRYRNTRDLSAYLAVLESPSPDPAKLRREKVHLSVKEQISEFMFLGLRTCRGVSLSDFSSRYGLELNELYKDVIDRYTGPGLLLQEGDRLFLTGEGLRLSNRVMADFLL